MAAYYNENDPKAAAWLRELIKAGHIANGVVDDRSICEVSPADVVGYEQCHWFAGIGGWSLALRLAGWPDSRPVWTGSCPCQPFSDAGKGGAENDARHLWPIWCPLIRERQPAIVFGEQVASKAALRWLDGVFADLEDADYACGAADLCAAGVGAPHIRQRLHWVANASSSECEWRAESEREQRESLHASDRSDVGRMANAELQRERFGESRIEGQSGIGRDRPAINGEAGNLGMGDTIGEGLEGHAGNVGSRSQSRRFAAQQGGPVATPGSAGFWSDFGFVPCRDGKKRRIEPGSFPMAHGVPGRVGLLRGYGNAIVPEVAAEFIKAWCEVTAT